MSLLKIIIVSISSHTASQTITSTSTVAYCEMNSTESSSAKGILVLQSVCVGGGYDMH